MDVIVGRGRDFATQKTEITEGTVSRKHCTLTDNGDGTFTLKDESSLGTFVDDVQVIKRIVTPDTILRLGPTYTVKVADLFPLYTPKEKDEERKLIGENPEPCDGYSVKGLEDVWNHYHETKLELQRRQHRMGLLIRIPMLFTAMSGILTAILPNEYRIYTCILTGISALLMIYGFFQQKDFVLAIEMDKLERWLQDNYVCPNPNCRCFLGNQPYHLLRMNKKCRYCGSKLNDK